MATSVLPSDTPNIPDQAAPPAKNVSNVASTVPRPLMPPAILTAEIYKWQPMGVRVTIKLPLVSNDKAPLFRIRVTPRLLTPARCLQLFQNAPSAYRNLFPVKLCTTKTTSANTDLFPDDSAVVLTQYAPPPLIASLVEGHRFWSGGLSYQIRCTSQMTNQAQVFWYPTPAVPDIFAFFDGSENYRAFSTDISQVYPSDYENTLQANSFVHADLSITRHCEVTVPYEKPFAKHDLFHEELGAIAWQDGDSGTDIAGTFSQWLNLGLKAGIDAGSGPREIFLELYIRAEPDFVCSGYRGFPPLLTEANEQSFISDYNMAPGKNPIIFPNSKVGNTRTDFTYTPPS